MVRAIIVVVVVVVGVLLVLALLSALSPSSSSSSSSNLTYSQAKPLADAAAQGTSGGSWALVLAGGISPTMSVVENVSTSSSDCNITVLPGGSSTVTIPAGPANQTGGTAPGWVFLYRNANSEMLLVTVLDGSATAWATIAAGQECSTFFDLLNVVSSSVIDSSAAAADLHADAAGFLAAHTGISSAYSLIGGVSFLGLHTGAEWEVNYTTCPLSAAPGTNGAAFNGTVNATSGAVIFSQTQATISCRSSSSIALERGELPGPALGPTIPASRRAF